MTSCARCGHELGIGRFCLNCGHPVGAPVPVDAPHTQDITPSEPSARADRAPSWLPWAAGAAVLVLLGGLLLMAALLGDDDADPTDAASTPSPSATETAEPVTRAVDLTRAVEVSAPPASPPTTDLDGQLVSYGPERMLDKDPSTAWRTAGDATGQTVTFTLAAPGTVRRVGIINGYSREVASGATRVSWYPHNRRITLVEWAFDDGTVVQQQLDEKPTLQRLTIDPVTTKGVRLRVLEVTPPGPGALGRDYTVISEVLIAGTPTV